MTQRWANGPGTVAPKSHPRPQELRWRWAFGVAVAVQLIVLYAPRAPAGPHVNGFDKVIHLAIFAVPVFAALMVGIRARWALVVFALHAPISELIQHFVLPHRSGDVFDAIADLSGVLLGGMAYVVWNRRQH
jgi:VanZ family protein